MRVSTLAPVGALLVLLASLATAPGVAATYPARNGLILFQEEDGQQSQLYTVRPNGHDLTQLTQGHDHSNGDWSPDGRRIVFTWDNCSIGIMRADGSDEIKLPVPPEDGAEEVDYCEGDASFTPDGSRIVFEHYDAAIDQDGVWSMKLDGSDRRLITTAGGPDPNVSPDGRTVTFKGAEGALFAVSIDGTGLRQVTPTMDVTYKHDWAPDGRHLEMSDNAEPEPDDAVNVFTIRPDGTGFHYVTHFGPGSWANAGSYSPDGQWILFRLDRQGTHTLYRIRPDGSDMHVIIGPTTAFKPRLNDWGPATRP